MGISYVQIMATGAPSLVEDVSFSLCVLKRKIKVYDGNSFLVQNVVPGAQRPLRHNRLHLQRLFRCQSVCETTWILESMRWMQFKFGCLTSPPSGDIINLNVDFVSPSCTMATGVWKYELAWLLRCSHARVSIEHGTDWHRYAYGYYLLLGIPFIPFALSLLMYGLAHLWSIKVGKRTVLGGTTLTGCTLRFPCRQLPLFRVSSGVHVREL